MKKRIFALAVVLTCLSILASTTLAYFTDIGTARNVITSGGIGIELIEQQLVGGTLQPWPEMPVPVMPGTAVSKIASAKNLEQPAWIRMNYTVTVYDAAGKTMDVPADELAEVIVIEPDGTEWIRKDGWWYYKAAVNTGETTEPLFEEVVFSGPHMDNKYQNCTVEVIVKAQGVQTANNGESALEAAGWPATE